jgi:predicted methyltransferase
VVPEALREALETFRGFAAGRPDVDVRLDQSHALPETALRRAAYVYENDGLEGRRVLVLGDDDLTSLALGLAARSLGLRVKAITVLEVDSRLCGFLSDAARSEGLPVEVVPGDLREPLPDRLRATQDAFLTDPPYTLEGLGLFVSRAVQALRPEPGKPGFICFGHRRPAEAAAAIGAIAAAGLAPVEIVPDFNHYVGAQMLAGRSQMIRTVFTGAGRPTVEGRYDGALYTADLRKGRGEPSV